MNDNTTSQVIAVLEAALHNLAVVSDQLDSLKDVKGVDVSAQVKELTETKESIATKLTELRSA